MNTLITGILFYATVTSGAAPSSAPAGERGNRPSAPAAGAKSDTSWHDARELTVEGRGWDSTETFYERLPAKAKGVATDSVWGLGKHTAGLAVHFATDAPRISARWTVLNASLAMPHMPATGVSGLDLYVKDAATWRWIGAGRPNNSPTNEVVLADGIPEGVHEYLLYLPLYNGVRSLEIGVPEGAAITKASPRPPERARPICVYGTSIVQGGCASRPGMAHVAILGRKLDWATVNLGFSGSGKMEPAMGDLLAEIDAAAYVLDCLPNMTTEIVRERLGPFVERLRAARPKTPIVLVEHVIPQYALFLPKPRSRNEEHNQAMREVYDRLVLKKITGLTYVPCGLLFGSDGEATVDGVHATDLGFARFADALEPVLRKVLAK